MMNTAPAIQLFAPARTALVLGFLLYGLFGVATPDRYTGLELVLLLLLMAGFAPMMLVRIAMMQPPGLCALLIAGISLPTIVGTVAGHLPSHILRDLVPFLFWCVPLMMPLFNPRALEHWVMGLALCFSVRALWISASPPDAGMDLDYLYLANSPLILMTGLLAAHRFLTHSLHGRACLFAAVAVVMMAVCLVYDLRAPSALMALGWGMMAFMIRGVNPVRLYTACVIALGCAFFYLGPELSDLIEKSERVGWNQRVAEAAAILDNAGDNPFALLFGAGWGARFASPAVGFIEVGYTHNLVTYLFWKTGLLGLCGFAGLVWVGLRHAVTLPMDRCVIAALVLIVPIGFYTTYKTLDFGLVIAVLSAWVRHSRERHRTGTEPL